MRRNEYLRPKTVPHTPNNRGITRNPPDVSPPPTIELSKLAVASAPNLPGVKSAFRVTADGMIKAQDVTIPTIKGPLTPVFHTVVGGGRVGGGGTSKEAIQRAKRKLKSRPARLKMKRG